MIHVVSCVWVVGMGGGILVGLLMTSLRGVLVCRGVVAWCGWVGVVECDRCFLVIERFLEGRGELEFVVEFVDGDEGSETLACFLGRLYTAWYSLVKFFCKNVWRDIG